MNVIFAAKAILKGKVYQKGHAILPDRLAYDSEFKAMVKDGKLAVVSRSEALQASQASKDALAQKLAQKAAKSVPPDMLAQHEKNKKEFAKAQHAKLVKANRK